MFGVGFNIASSTKSSDLNLIYSLEMLIIRFHEFTSHTHRFLMYLDV